MFMPMHEADLRSEFAESEIARNTIWHRVYASGDRVVRIANDSGEEVRLFKFATMPILK